MTHHGNHNCQQAKLVEAIVLETSNTETLSPCLLTKPLCEDQTK